MFICVNTSAYLFVFFPIFSLLYLQHNSKFRIKCLSNVCLIFKIEIDRIISHFKDSQTTFNSLEIIWNFLN